MIRKILILLFLLFFFVTANGDDLMENNKLFGIPVTTWVFEGHNYSYNLGFEYPNNVTFIIFTQEIERISYNIGIIRRGVFNIENNILTVNFIESQRNVLNTHGEWHPDFVTVTMEIETDGRTYLNINQINGENIFINDINKNVEFRASIMPIEI